MTDRDDQHGRNDQGGQLTTTVEDQAFLDGARRLRDRLHHPLVIGVLAVGAAVALFLMGVSVGDAVYHAFDGDGAAAATFGVALVVTLGLLTALVGAARGWRRSRSRRAAGR